MGGFAPGDCPHELRTLEYGGNVRSLCDLRGHETWTNCRSFGECVLGDARGDDGDGDGE